MQSVLSDATAEVIPDASPANGPLCLHELFEMQVDLRGGAVAIACDEISLTYAEVDKRANRLTHYLRELGAGPGHLVGLAFERSELPIIAILACLKAGAAYVPIDPTHPDERIRYIVEEAAIAVMLTERSVTGRMAKVFNGTLVSVDTLSQELAAQPECRLPRAQIGLSSGDLCYVIYTSGTTGRPKGVMTEHRNAVHFVASFNAVCKTTPEDRVYQGFSLGFDGSVEEIWMAFSNGACLVVGSRNAPRFGNDLAHSLARQDVTYFSTVPTMLSTMTDDVPSLRQLVVSGEVCPPELVTRWARPGRLMLNVYGPTEATVNTTAFVCKPGERVTIGRPLPGYTALILDTDMRPLSPGEKGELYVGGAGVSRGYIKQPELTARQFVASPHTEGRLYRTGDLARFNERGEIEFFGRIDSQVKIRGFRVELSEIESILREEPSIASAAVKLHDRDGVDCLAAYVVLDTFAAPLDRHSLQVELRARLPVYMVPSYLDVVAALPMLASGKVDRKQLPEPLVPLVDEGAAAMRPATELESKIAQVWETVFKIPQVGVEQDFFLDLGGHSLIAAQTANALRHRAGLHIAVRDLYAFPTVRKLAQHVAKQNKPERAPAGIAASLTGVARKPPLAMTVMQALLIVVYGVLLSLPLVIVIPVADNLLRARISIIQALVILFLLGLALWPLMLAIGIGAKWIIIGRYRAGAYPLWGSYYYRWWLVSQLQGLAALGPISGTPLMAFYYRLMGAKVGKHCAIETGLCSAWDLVSIGDDSSIGADTQLLGYRIENGFLILGRVDIGRRCFVGVHSALALDVRMEDDTRLDDQSLLADGETIPAGEHRRGSPARPAEVSLPAGEIRRDSIGRKILFTVSAFLLSWLSGWFSALPGIGLLLVWLTAFAQGWIVLAIVLSAAALPLFVVTTCLWIALLKAMMLRRAKPGVYPLYSLYHLRHWLAYGLMRISRFVLLPLFTTLYLPPWMRLLGAKLGAHVEMSTIWSFMPELLVAGDGSFFADGCILGGKRMFGGRFEIATNRIGTRSFIGNSAILPTGASLGDHCLLGVLSAPPSRTEPVPDGTDWLGSPSFRLPNRQKVAGFNDNVTFRPPRKLYVQRALVDACRILIPGYTGFVLGLAGIVALLFTYETYGAWVMIATASLWGWASAAIAVAIVVALKWAVMGRFKPVIVPLWCPYVWFNEMVNGAYESIMAPVVTTFFGTPFAAPILRLLGCKIGRYCYVGTALFSEFDLVEIGDYAALNAGVVIQNHLFEDRIMKSSYLTVGERCTVGNMAVVLYDTAMEPEAVLAPLSLLMKGETMPAGSRWRGIPTVAD